jgi:hypothetical protein
MKAIEFHCEESALAGKACEKPSFWRKPESSPFFLDWRHCLESGLRRRDEESDISVLGVLAKLEAVTPGFWLSPE